MNKIGEYIIPISVGLIIIFGLIRKVPVFDMFIQGAKNGIKSTVNIIPPMVALILSVTMMNASGALDIFSSFLKPLTNLIGFPSELLPLAILRPVSGSGSIAMLNNIFNTCGVDSFAGKLGSVMMGSTETTFYIIAIFFGSLGIKNTRHAVISSLMADISSVFISLFVVNLLFN